MSSKGAVPILRWAGSKRRLLPLLLSNIPSGYVRYYEPFAGSACLYLATKPEAAVLGDLNGELIGAYRTIKLHASEVANGLAKLPEDTEFYYWIREYDPASLGEVDRAIRFIYLNRFCFNGVYRTNKQGRFNVPRGTRTGSVPTFEEIEAFSNALQCAELRAGDFQDNLSDVGMGDFVYLDPPYAMPGKKDRGEYGPGKFVTKDIERLAVLLNDLRRRGAKVLLSYADEPLLTQNFGDWKIQKLSVQRSVSGFAKNRGTVQEVLISNY